MIISISASTLVCLYKSETLCKSWVHRSLFKAPSCSSM